MNNTLDDLDDLDDKVEYWFFDSALGNKFVRLCAKMYGYNGNFTPNIIYYAQEYLLEHPEMIPEI